MNKNNLGIWLLVFGIVGKVLSGSGSVIGIALDPISGLCIFAAIVILIIQGVKMISKKKQKEAPVPLNSSTTEDEIKVTKN